MKLREDVKMVFGDYICEEDFTEDQWRLLERNLIHFLPKDTKILNYNYSKACTIYGFGMIHELAQVRTFIGGKFKLKSDTNKLLPSFFFEEDNIVIEPSTTPQPENEDTQLLNLTPKHAKMHLLETLTAWDMASEILRLREDKLALQNQLLEKEK